MKLILGQPSPSPRSILHHELAFLISLSESVHHLSGDHPDLQAPGSSINEDTALKDQTCLQNLR